jgi:hypothetical protein
MERNGGSRKKVKSGKEDAVKEDSLQMKNPMEHHLYCRFTENRERKWNKGQFEEHIGPGTQGSQEATDI